MSSVFRKTLRELLESEGLESDPRLLDLMDIHWNLLARWNRKMNLTAIRDDVLAAERLYFDSLVVVRWLRGTPAIHDVGSGAGFPGLVLKAALTDCKVYISEAREKKVTFLREAARRMGLSDGLSIAKARLGWDKNVHPQCDEAISRAAFPPDVWIELARGLVKKGGRIWVMLGHHAAGECQDEPGEWLSGLPDGLVVEVDRKYVLPLTGAKRRLIGMRSTVTH